MVLPRPPSALILCTAGVATLHITLGESRPLACASGNIEVKACLFAVSCRCGGPVLSLEYMDTVKQWADAKGVPIHLDGARIFNAAAYLGGCCLPFQSGPACHQFSAAACLVGCCLAVSLAVAQH